MQEPQRSHGADTDSDDYYGERDGSAEENALNAVQPPFRSRHGEIRSTEFNVSEIARQGSECSHNAGCDDNP
jgi:hypothetical protein